MYCKCTDAALPISSTMELLFGYFFTLTNYNCSVRTEPRSMVNSWLVVPSVVF